MQESRVQSLFWEDPVCHGATKSVHQLLSPCSTACALQKERPAQWEARTLQRRADPHSPQLEKASSVTKMQHGQKIIKKYNVFRKDQQRQRRGTESALFKRGSSPTFYIGQKGIHLWDKAGGALGGLGRGWAGLGGRWGTTDLTGNSGNGKPKGCYRPKPALFC